MLLESDLTTQLSTNWETSVIAKPSMHHGTIIPDRIEQYPVIVVNVQQAVKGVLICHNPQAWIEDTPFQVQTIAQTLANLILVDNQVFKWLNKSITGGFWMTSGDIDRKGEAERSPRHLIVGKEKKFVTTSL